MNEFRETREQEAARKRVRKWAFGHWRKQWAKQQPEPEPKPTIRTANGGLEPWAQTVVPSPSSKQPRYSGAKLTRYEVNLRYRESQKEIPCSAMRDKVGVQEPCGKPSWGGGLCQACYKRIQKQKKRLIPRLIEAQMMQHQEAQP